MFECRDLGGIKNKENKVIKNNMLIRSSNLYRLKKHNINKLKKLNVTKIIDLRTNIEAKEKPDIKLKKVKYIHIPIISKKIEGITHESENNKIEKLKNVPNMEKLYALIVTNEYCVKQLRKLMNEIINSNDFSILFHCTAGKDRTGIVSMLLLSILDVDINSIMKDYLYMDIRRILKANMYYYLYKLKTKNKVYALNLKSVFITDEKYLNASINAINKKYGNMENFIQNELKITNDKKEKFKLKVLK